MCLWLYDTTSMFSVVPAAITILRGFGPSSQKTRLVYRGHTATAVSFLSCWPDYSSSSSSSSCSSFSPASSSIRNSYKSGQFFLSLSIPVSACFCGLCFSDGNSYPLWKLAVHHMRTPKALCYPACTPVSRAFGPRGP